MNMKQKIRMDNFFNVLLNASINSVGSWLIKPTVSARMARRLMSVTSRMVGSSVAKSMSFDNTPARSDD